MNSNTHCPHCHTTNIIRNGHCFHTGKQKFICKRCHKHFVKQGQEWFIGHKERKMIDGLLLEKISLRGICRVMQVSLTWLMHYVNEKYRKLPRNLFYQFSNKYKYEKGRLYVRMVPLQADEMWPPGTDFCKGKEEQSLALVSNGGKFSTNFVLPSRL